MTPQPTAVPPPNPEAGDGEPEAAGQGTLEFVALGQRLRLERTRQRIGLRELAGRVGVSASAISQIELGQIRPSVSTLHHIASQLGLSADALLSAAEIRRVEQPLHAEVVRRHQRSASSAPPDIVGTPLLSGEVVRAGSSAVQVIPVGITVEVVTGTNGGREQFLLATYDVGAASADGASFTSTGHEHGYVIAGRLGITLEGATYELGAGDSISFDAAVSHRVFNLDDSPARMLWCLTRRP